MLLLYIYSIFILKTMWIELGNRGDIFSNDVRHTIQKRKPHSFEWKDLWVKRQSSYMDKYIETKEKFCSKGFFLEIFTALQFLEIKTERYL